MRFQDKTVLVTGGTSGIGLATAKRLANEGAHVIVTGSRQDSLDQAASELPGARFLLNDAGDPAAAESLASAVRSLGRTLDAAFLNAGFGRFHPLDAVTSEEFDAHFNVLVKGPLLQTRALAPLLRDGGSVVLTTSVVNNLGMPGAAIYSAAKGAARTLTRVLARELAPRGIRVNAVSPGPIGTGFFARTGMSQQEIEGMAEQILAQVPLGRFGTPEDVAAVAAFLLSDEAAFVTGSEYVVDGGMSEL